MDALFSYNIFPNPNKGEFIINIHSSTVISDYDILIINSIGKEVYKNSISTNSTDYQSAINLQSLSPGVYHVSIRNSSSAVNKRIVIMK